MEDIIVGKIFDAVCDEVDELFVVRVLSVDKISRTFAGEIFHKKDVQAQIGIMKPALIEGIWDFSGRSDDVPCFVKIKTKLKAVS